MSQLTYQDLRLPHGGLAQVVGAAEDVWQSIRAWHPEAPHAVVLVAPLHSRRARTIGHWFAGRWTVDGEPTGEVFLAGELIAQGPEALLHTLLHEAAHALGFARGIKDTSRQGRYHNTHYRLLAEQIGLRVERDDAHGWSLTALTPLLLDKYAEERALLATVCPECVRTDLR